MNTKGKLIASALKLFNKKGFENTSTTSICTDAGFSSGALFVHFNTKNDLLDYIYVSIKKEYFRFVFEVMDEEDIVKKTEIIIQRSFKFYLANYEKFMFMDQFANSHHISRIAQEEVSAELQEIFQIFEEGKKQGVLTNIDSPLIMQTTGAMLYGLVKYYYDNLSKDVNEGVGLIMKVIKK